MIPMTLKPISKKIASALQHLHYRAPTHIIYDLPLDDGDRLLVVGDPDNGGYEWCFLFGSGEPQIQSSNCAYGCSTVALRDGLVKYHGLPASLENLFPEHTSVPSAS